MNTLSPDSHLAPVAQTANLDGRLLARSIDAALIRPRRVACVRQRQIAYAQLVVQPQHGHSRVDRVAALHTHQTGDLAVAERIGDAVGRRHQAHVLRIEGDQALQRVDLVQRQFDGVLVVGAAADVGHPEL